MRVITLTLCSRGGEYGEWNHLLPGRTPVQCKPTIYPGEGIYVQVNTPPLKVLT